MKNIKNILLTPDRPRHNLDRFSPSRNSSNLDLAGHLTLSLLSSRTPSPQATKLNTFCYNSSRNARPENVEHRSVNTLSENAYLRVPNFELVDKLTTSPRTGFTHTFDRNKGNDSGLPPTLPSKTLDAPGLVKDPTCRILNWGGTGSGAGLGLLAISLGAVIYIYDPKSNGIIETIGRDNDDGDDTQATQNVSQLLWDGMGTSLAYTYGRGEGPVVTIMELFVISFCPNLNNSKVAGEVSRLLKHSTHKYNLEASHLKFASLLEPGSEPITLSLAWEQSILCGTSVDSRVDGTTSVCYLALWDTSHRLKDPLIAWSTEFKKVRYYGDTPEPTHLTVSLSSHRRGGYVVCLVATEIFVWDVGETIFKCWKPSNVILKEPVLVHYLDLASNWHNLGIEPHQGCDTHLGNPDILSALGTTPKVITQQASGKGQSCRAKRPIVNFINATWLPRTPNVLVCVGMAQNVVHGQAESSGVIAFLDVERGSFLSSRTLLTPHPVVDVTFASNGYDDAAIHRQQSFYSVHRLPQTLYDELLRDGTAGDADLRLSSVARHTPYDIAFWDDSTPIHGDGSSSSGANHHHHNHKLHLGVDPFPTVPKFSLKNGWLAHGSQILKIDSCSTGHQLVTVSCDESIKFWSCRGSRSNRYGNKPTSPTMPLSSPILADTLEDSQIPI